MRGMTLWWVMGFAWFLLMVGFVSKPVDLWATGVRAAGKAYNCECVCVELREPTPTRVIVVPTVAPYPGP